MEWLQGHGANLRTAALERLDSCLSTGTGIYASDLANLEHWYSSLGVAGLLTRKVEALQNLHWAHDCGCLLFWMKALQFDSVRQQGLLKNPRWMPLNDAAMRVSRALFLRRFADAVAIHKRVVAGLRDEFLSLTDVTRLGPFILRLVAEWRGEPDPVVGVFGLLSEPAYEEMLAIWRIPDASALQQAVDSMCSVHRTRSGEPDDNEWFEFSWDFEYLWPVEILTVFALREELGLSYPEIREPYFPESLRRLPSLEPRMADPFLLRVRQKLEGELGQPLPGGL